jgi:hypothetical protein
MMAITELLELGKRNLVWWLITQY